MSARAITLALGGSWAGLYGLALCPVHGDKTPSLKVRDDCRRSGGIDVHCFAGCDHRDVKAELKLQGLLSGSASVAASPLQPSSSANREPALKIWAGAVPLPGTLGEFYLAEHRGLRMHAHGDLSHILRWCGGNVNAIVALMTHAVSGEPSGIQRIFVSPNDGRKLDKRMLGPAGVIRISPDEDVTLGLGITEGIEDALTAVQLGWAPMWAAGSAGAIKKFPVLSGIEPLTIFRDDNKAGIDAADECAKRWHAAGRDVDLVSIRNCQL